MAFVGLSIIGDVWWWVTILVLVREWGITLLRLWVIRHGVMAAGSRRQAQDRAADRRAGLLHPADPDPPGRLGRVGDVLWGVAVVLMVAAVTVTVVPVLTTS